MNTSRPFLRATHTFFLGLWFGSLVMTGIAAAIIFPTVKHLQPQVPAYASYRGEHWLLLAGKVAERIFTAADIVQFVCACVAVGAFLVMAAKTPEGWRTPERALRVTLLVAALTTLAYQILVLGPRMHLNLTEFWNAAGAGQQANADRFQAAFDADHPTASTVLGITVALVGAAFALAAWPGRDARAPSGGSGQGAGA
jgi:hypothetical protein